MPGDEYPHWDESAPKRERWRVLRPLGDPDHDATRWVTVESFGVEKQAHAFAQGFTLGSQYVAPPDPIGDRLSLALQLVKSARDDYKRECQDLRARLRELESAAKIAA